jgi:hypothetical protein
MAFKLMFDRRHTYSWDVKARRAFERAWDEIANSADLDDIRFVDSDIKVTLTPDYLLLIPPDMHEAPPPKFRQRVDASLSRHGFT